MNQVLKTMQKKLSEFQRAKGKQISKEAFCPLEQIYPSPVETLYRNKCEFSIGDGNDGLPTVGFMLGLYKDGVVTVVVSFFLSFFFFSF